MAAIGTLPTELLFLTGRQKSRKLKWVHGSVSPGRSSLGGKRLLPSEAS